MSKMQRKKIGQDQCPRGQDMFYRSQRELGANPSMKPRIRVDSQ